MNAKFDRAGTGNEEGIKAMKEAIDPLKQKNIMLRGSLLKRLKMAAFLDDERSESQIIAEALEPLI